MNYKAASDPVRSYLVRSGLPLATGSGLYYCTHKEGSYEPESAIINLQILQNYKRLHKDVGGQDQNL